MNRKVWVLIAGCCGLTGVALGAFGAHGLRNVLTDDLLRTYNTGILYHLIHSVVILAIGLAGDTRFFKSAIFFLAGILLFSFSLYAFALTGISWIAIITPFGGISFLIGWFLIIAAAIKNSHTE